MGNNANNGQVWVNKPLRHSWPRGRMGRSMATPSPHSCPSPSIVGDHSCPPGSSRNSGITHTCPLLALFPWRIFAWRLLQAIRKILGQPLPSIVRTDPPVPRASSEPVFVRRDADEILRGIQGLL